MTGAWSDEAAWRLRFLGGADGSSREAAFERHCAELRQLAAAALRGREAGIVQPSGLSGPLIDEVADGIGVSPRTVAFDWAMAQAWLRSELERG